MQWTQQKFVFVVPSDERCCLRFEIFVRENYKLIPTYYSLVGVAELLVDCTSYLYRSTIKEYAEETSLDIWDNSVISKGKLDVEMVLKKDASIVGDDFNWRRLA